MKIESKFEIGDIAITESRFGLHTYDPYIIIDIDHYDSEVGFIYKCVDFRTFQCARENNRKIDDILKSKQQFGFEKYDLINERLLFKDFNEVIESLNFTKDSINIKIERMQREKDLYFETFIKK